MPVTRKKQALVLHEGQLVPVPTNEFRDFIAKVLKILKWQDVNTPRDLKTVTASFSERTQGNARWDFNFELEIKYSKAGPSTTRINYELWENNQKLKNKCQEKLDQLVGATHELALEMAETKAEEPSADTYGDAKFADEEELRARNYITKDIPGNRLLLAPWGQAEYVTVPPQFTYMHGMICGPTGSGKSSGFFVPNLVYRLDSSVIVTEATAGGETPELFANTAGWRQFKGNKVYFFNPDYPRGTRINPLDKLKYTPDSDFAAVADELANLVIINTTPPTATRSDPIWDKSEKHLLWIMIMHVARSGDPKLTHFGAIREMLRKSDKQIKTILKNSKSEIAKEEYEAFLSHSSDNFRHGVFAGLLQRLNPWLSSVVQTMTSATDLDLEELEHQKFSFYISAPSRKQHLKPIAALIFNFILDLSLQANYKYPPAMMLDEFTNFGAIPGIDKALSIIRKRNLPVILGFQTQNQLNDLYGKSIAKDITSQLATRIFFKPRHPEDAEALSDALDDTTIVEKKTDDRGNTMVREIGRPLMSVRQIATLDPTQVIIMTENTNPIKTTRFDHISCPQPSGFDPPELVEHELMQIERLSDPALAAAAKTAKAKAEKEMGFPAMAANVQDVIATAEERYQPTSPEPFFPPEPASVTAPEEPPKPKPKTKRKKPVYDDLDDIPG